MDKVNQKKADEFNADHVVVNISGGKDSSVLMQYAVDHFPKEKIICIHAEIDIDWNETKDIVKQQAEHFGLPVVFVQAVHADGRKKGFLSVLTSKRKNRKSGMIGEYFFPSMAQRWCTSDLKVAPIEKWIRRNLTGKIIQLIGERREESTRRAILEAWRPHHKLSKAGREVITFSPILDMLERQVWNIIKFKKIPVHPCYGWGVSRASCAICIFSSDKEIAIAAEKAPGIVAKYLEAESKISHTFRYKPATKKRAELKITVAEILEGQRTSCAS